MAQQDLQFFSAARPRDWVTKDRAYTFTFKAYDAGTQAVPSSATITIKKPGGADLATPVSGAAVTIAGGGDMTYTLTSGNAGELGANYTADVAYVVSGTTYSARFVFDVVRVPLRNVVIQSDLTKHHIDLTDLLASGESNTQTYIAQAFEDVCTYLEGRDIRPYLALNPEVFRRSIEHRALELFFGAKTKQPEDRWALLRDRHATAYNTELQALGTRLIHDIDQSGTADGTSTEGASGEEGSRNTGFSFRI